METFPCMVRRRLSELCLVESPSELAHASFAGVVHDVLEDEPPRHGNVDVKIQL